MRLKAFENDDHPRTSAGPYRCRMRKSMAKSIHPIHLCSVLLKWVVGNLFLVSYLCLATRRGHWMDQESMLQIFQSVWQPFPHRAAWLRDPF